MKKIKCLLLVLVCCFVSPLTAKADCDNQRMAELNKIAGNVQISYSYEVDENNIPVLTTNITNVTEDIYVIDMFGNVYRDFDNIASPNISYIYIYSNDPNCGGQLLKKGLNYPMYNVYHNLDICNNNSSPMCEIWRDTTVYSEEVFREYVKGESTKESQQLSEEQQSETNDFNIYMIMAIIVLLIIVFFVIMLVKKRKE